MKLNFLLRMALAGMVVLVLLLGVSTAQAATVIRDATLTNSAVAILALEVDGVYYDVEFLNASAIEIYGDYPGTYDFSTYTTVTNAAEEVNVALRGAGGITEVGEAGITSHKIGFDFRAAGDVKFVIVQRTRSDSGAWSMLASSEENLYGDTTMFADFEVVPEPSITALLLIGLAAFRLRRG
jgi:hypothetical protein